MGVMKIETYIISCITVSPIDKIGQAVILGTLYAKTFKTNVIVFIGNIVNDVTPTYLFHYQSQSIDTENISQ